MKEICNLCVKIWSWNRS